MLSSVNKGCFAGLSSNMTLVKATANVIYHFHKSHTIQPSAVQESHLLSESATTFIWVVRHKASTEIACDMSGHVDDFSCPLLLPEALV